MSDSKDKNRPKSTHKGPVGGGLRKVGVFSIRGGGTIPGEDRLVRVHKERIVIGSVISADVRISGAGVEPIHAVLELPADPMNADQPAQIFDLASESGVFIDGRKLVTAHLKGGETLRIGRHEIVFRIEDVEQYTSRERIRSSEGRSLFLNPNEDFAPLILQDEREVDEIFDYRSTHKPAIEIVMSWRGTILDVQHFAGERAIFVGTTPKCDFGVPALLSSPHFPLVTRSGSTFTLQLDTQMKGVMQRKGSLAPLSQVRDGATRGPFGYQIEINKDDFAKISVGEVDFYLSFTSAPPTLKRQKVMDRDPFLIKVLLSSMLFTTLMIVALLNVHVPKIIEAEELPERIATILYTPEKYVSPRPKIRDTTPALLPDSKVPKPRNRPKPPPKKVVEVKPVPKPEVTPPKKTTIDFEKERPKPTPAVQTRRTRVSDKNQTKGSQVSQGQAKEGEGAKARGKEGERGSKTAKTTGTTAQTQAKRPSPDAGKGRGGSRSQAKPDEGNLDFLKGAGNTIKDLLGSSSARLGKGGEQVAGFGGFDTKGKGGLGLSGTGSGGGGTADTLTGGLGSKGRGGGRVGVGLGAAGSGDGIVGGKVRVVLRTGGAEEAVVMGAIDPDAVERAILAHKDEFRYCYEREINAGQPALAGRVTPSFTIGARGTVTAAGMASSTIGNANVEKCVLKVLKRIQFPEPRGGGIVEVKYPFKFRPTGG